MSRLVLFAVALIGTLCPTSVYAQFLNRSFSHSAAESAGLEKVWQSQATVNPARGEVSNIQLLMSKKNFTYLYDVKHGETTTTFNSGRLDRYGQPIGRAVAAKLADIELRVLKTQGVEATVTQRRVPDVTVLVQTSSGIIQGIDSETGRTLWSMSDGNPQYPSLGPAASDDYAAMINGSTLYVYNLAEKKTAWSRRLDSAPIADPIITNNRVFVPMLRGVVLGYDLDKGKRPTASMTSIGRPIVSPASTDITMNWGTDRGFLYVANPRTAKPLFRLEASDLLNGPAVPAPGEMLIASSRDGYVYALGERIGELVWRFSVGGPMEHAVSVIGKQAFAATDTGLLFALSTEIGSVNWSAVGVSRVLSASGSRLYCAGTNDDLVVLDINSGGRLASAPINTKGALTNPLNDRLYLATSYGAIACLREPQNIEPVFHQKIASDSLADSKGDAAADGDEPSDLSNDAGDADPFAEDADDSSDDPFAEDADPFADEGDGADPFADEGDGADPFAEDDPPADEAAEDDPFAEGEDGVDEDPFAEN